MTFDKDKVTLSNVTLSWDHLTCVIGSFGYPYFVVYNGIDERPIGKEDY